MTPIETLQHLQEELDSIESVEREKRKEVSEQIFDPLHEKRRCVRETIKNLHKIYVNYLRGKYYRMKPDKQCMFMSGSIAFMIIGYVNENYPVLLEHIPVLSLTVYQLLSEIKQIDYHEYDVSVPPTFYRDAKSSYERFIRFLDEYCEEISDEEFHELLIDTVKQVEEFNMTIIPKEEDDDDMSDSVDVIDESEDDDYDNE